MVRDVLGSCALGRCVMRYTHKKRRRPAVVSEEPPITLGAVVRPQQLRNNVLDVRELMENMPRQLSH